MGKTFSNNQTVNCTEIQSRNQEGELQGFNYEVVVGDVDIVLPRKITLVNNPNFITFRNGYDGQIKQPSQIDIKIKGHLTREKGGFTLQFVENISGAVHRFIGVSDETKLDNNSFLVANDSISSVVSTVYNLRECLMRNVYIRNNFNIIIIPPTKEEEFQTCGEECFSSVGGTIRLTSYGFGKQYNCDVSVENEFNFQIDKDNRESLGTDFIDNGLGNYKIELDIYTDTGIGWGKKVDDLYLRGTYLTTLSKSYFGKSLWFELNTLMSKKSSYSPLFLNAFDDSNANWVDTGTMTDFRFVARRTGQNMTEPIYISDVLYTINGYDYTLDDSHLGYDDVELDNYILDLNVDFENKEFDRKVKPLTSNLERTHLIGQRQYLNYIIKRRESESENTKTIEIALLYKLYTQSGRLIDEIVDLQMDTDQMQVMNTTQLCLDRFLPVYNDKTVGQIDVCLIVPIENDLGRKYVEISQTMTFRILPSGLHTVNDFAFLNRLGGWDSMNFGGSTSNEFKVTSSSIFKTLQPGFKSYTEVESVASKSVEEKFTVQSSPIARNIVEWLREMSASPAVYELSTRRYVLIDDMTLKYNSSDDLFQIDLKYHYSDVFNGRMK